MAKTNAQYDIFETTEDAQEPSDVAAVELADDVSDDADEAADDADDDDNADEDVPEPVLIEEKEIEISQVKVDFYPRNRVSSSNVTLLRELICHGAELDPIRVVFSPDDQFYYLLDGMHRTESYKAEGHATIKAQVFSLPKKFWAIYTVLYNTGNPLNLEYGDRKAAIYRAYTVDNLSRKQIIKALRLKSAYVYFLLKRERTNEKRQKENELFRLHAEEGKTVRELETLTGLPKSTIHRHIECGKKRFDSVEKRRVTLENKKIALIKDKAQRFESVNEKSISVDFSPELREALTAEYNLISSTETTQAQAHADQVYMALVDQVDYPEATEMGPNDIEMADTGTLQPGEDNEYDLRVRVPGAASLEKAQKEPLNSTQKAALYVFAMIGRGQSVSEIAEALACPEEWVRNTAFVLLFLNHYSVISVEEIELKLGIKPERIHFIKSLFDHFTSALPSREQLFSWIDTNMPANHDSRYTQICRREKLYWYCIRNNRPIPWQQDSSELFDIPAQIGETYDKTIAFLEKFKGQLRNKTINKEQAQVLLEKNNRLQVMINVIARFLADNANREC